VLRLGQRVIIVTDSFEQNLPVGQHGYIIAYDRNADNAFDYVVRVPSANKHFYLPAADIELEETLLSIEAERIEKEALIDYALATHNEELFQRVMNGNSKDSEDAENDSDAGKLQSREDFVKQINLKAWI
jgi:hypothetical protein